MFTLVVRPAMRTITCLIALILVVSGCKKSTLPIPPPTDIQLRIQNATPWDFQNCIVDPPGNPSSTAGPAPFNFGIVNKNQKSGYQPFETLYRYSSINLTMNGKSYSIQPFDYVGEVPLNNGRYTYKLIYIAANDRLDLELIID